MDYVRSSGMKVPYPDSCPQAKNAVINICMKDAWRDLFGLTSDKCQTLSAAEISKVLDDHFKEVAVDETLDSESIRRKSLSSMKIDKKHLMHFVEKKGMPRKGSMLIAQMIKALDANKDGEVNRKEFEDLVH